MSGNTNNTVFIQRLFSSRDNFVDGNVAEATASTANFVGDEGRIWWDPVRNAFYSSDGTTPGGFIIGGGGALDNYSFAALPSHVTGLVAANSTYMALYWHDQTGSTNTMALMTTGNLGTTATLIGRITYISAA